MFAELLSGIRKEVEAGSLPPNVAAGMEDVYHNYKNAVSLYSYSYFEIAILFIKYNLRRKPLDTSLLYIYITKLFLIYVGKDIRSLTIHCGTEIPK